MDDPQSAFQPQYPAYPFDLDMMKVCLPLLPSHPPSPALLAPHGHRRRPRRQKAPLVPHLQRHRQRPRHPPRRLRQLRLRAPGGLQRLPHRAPRRLHPQHLLHVPQLPRQRPPPDEPRLRHRFRPAAGPTAAAATTTAGPAAATAAADQRRCVRLWWRLQHVGHGPPGDGHPRRRRLPVQPADGQLWPGASQPLAPLPLANLLRRAPPCRALCSPACPR